MKNEVMRKILVPTKHDSMRREVRYFFEWYNESRLHNALDGQTPNTSLFQVTHHQSATPYRAPRTLATSRPGRETTHPRRGQTG
jgi:hypothetical protein